MRESTLQSRTYFSEVWCSPTSPLKCITHGDGTVVIQHGLKLSTRCTGSGASQEVQGKSLPVPFVGLPGRSYRATCRWLLLVLGLEVPKIGHATK